MNRLRRVYARVPKIHCKGQCANSCGPISISRTELSNIKRYCEEHGIEFHSLPEALDLENLREDHRNGMTKPCPYLVDDQCSVYEARPLICRFYGTTEALPCPQGCQCERPLTDAQGSELMQRVR